MPFPKLFAVFGYFVFSLFAVLTIAELFSFLVIELRHKMIVPAPFKAVATSVGSCRGIGRQHCVVKTSDDFASGNRTYDGLPWAEEFWKDQRVAFAFPWQYEPFTVWKSRPIHSKYINVDSTESGIWRRGLAPPKQCKDARIKQVWVFGGSSIFGVGAPDFATVSSYLSEELNTSSDTCFEVINLGVAGYDSNQELILLSRQLLKRKPDIAIFVDGFDDAFVGAFSPGQLASAHMGLAEIQARVNGTIPAYAPILERLKSVQLMAAIYRRLNPSAAAQIETVDENGLSIGSTAKADDLTRKAKSALDNYERNAMLIQALARRYNFKAQIFWQPWLLSGSKPLAPSERALKEHPIILDPNGQFFVQAISAVYSEAEVRSNQSNDFAFLGHIFDTEQRPIFIDAVHSGPDGNRAIAKEIARRILNPPKSTTSSRSKQ